MDGSGGSLSDLHEPEILPYLPLLGSIAVDSARLEWGLAGLHALLAPGRGMSRSLGLTHDRLQRSILRDVGAGMNDEDPFAGAVAYWARTASELLHRRGKVMHSAWIVGQAADGTGARVFTQHNRSGDKDQRSVQDLTAFARELNAHMSNFPATWAAAMLLAGIRSPAGDHSGEAGSLPSEPPEGS